MSANKQLQAAARAGVGKGAARATRREGRVPAVIYGGGQPPTAISLNLREATKILHAGHFLTTVFDIDVDGAKTRAIPRDYQLDPVRDTLIHVDFLRLSAGQTLRVEIPVHFLNQEASPGLKAGGKMNVVLHEIECNVPADAIPDSIDVDLTGLEIGDSVHMDAITFPANVTPVSKDGDFTVVAIAAPTADEDEPAAAEATPAA